MDSDNLAKLITFSIKRIKYSIIQSSYVINRKLNPWWSNNSTENKFNFEFKKIKNITQMIPKIEKDFQWRISNFKKF